MEAKKIKAASILPDNWKEFIEMNSTRSSGYQTIKTRLTEEKLRLENLSYTYEKMTDENRSIVDKDKYDSYQYHFYDGYVSTSSDGYIFESEETRNKIINQFAEKIAIAKAAIKAMSKAKKEFEDNKKKFIESCSYNMTEDQVKEYLDKYNFKDNPDVVITNKWKYYDGMGSYGNTNATMRIGKGKEKPLDKWGLPDWRPIAHTICRTSGVPRWMGGDSSYEIVIQSWDDLFKHLSDYDNQYFNIYKHPFQD